MNFDLTSEQHQIRETAQRVGRQFGLEYWRACDAEKRYPAEAWQSICDSGLCGAAMPEEFGGSGLGMLDLAIAVEALCAAGGGSTLSQLFMCNPIFGGVTLTRFGSEKQRQLLRGLSTGNVTFAMALTEPDAGTNSLALSTFARPHEDGWHLNGRKIWITAVAQATHLLVVARTREASSDRPKTSGISLFIVENGRAGISHSPIEKVGTNTLPASNVYFDNVRLAQADLVGELHEGFRQLLDVLNTERIVTTSGLVGAAELSINLAVEYAKTRVVFGGRPIGAYQAVQFPLSEAKVELECARLMNYKAAALYDAGRPYASEANMAKFLAGRAAGLATDRAMQTLGGMGYAKDYDIERLWRDARLFRIAPVSEEMILNFISQHDLGLPRSY